MSYKLKYRIIRYLLQINHLTLIGQWWVTEKNTKIERRFLSRVTEEKELPAISQRDVNGCLALMHGICYYSVKEITATRARTGGSTATGLSRLKPRFAVRYRSLPRLQTHGTDGTRNRYLLPSCIHYTENKHGFEPSNI